MIRVQASLFPVESSKPDEVIKRSIDAMRQQGLQCEVGPISTEISGEPTQVWQGLRTAFETAMAEGGEVSMTVTMTNAQI